MSKWISVDERLPKTHEKRDGSKDVLVVVVNDRNEYTKEHPCICAGYYTEEGWYTYMSNRCCKVGDIKAVSEYDRYDRVTYWRKMPKFKPQKENSNTEA